ncbi:MAG: hypothetical protein LBJ47_01870, partial [Tannerella sp.]|nr:hypothetical protein [Tannerella sp.]
IFYQTVSQETTGLLFWALSLYWLAKYTFAESDIRIRYYAGFMAASLCAALIKESFILVLPASYAFYCMIYCKKHGDGFLKTLLNTRKTGLFLCLLTVAGLTAVLIHTGYGAAGDQGGLKPYVKATLYLYGVSGGVVPAFAGAIYLWRKKITPPPLIYNRLLYMCLSDIVVSGDNNSANYSLCSVRIG